MSKRKGNQHVNNAFEFGLYAICTFCIVYYTVRKMYPKTFQAVLIITVLLLIRWLVKWTKIELFPALRFTILFFITVAMLLANLFGLYGIIPYLDKMEHLLSGVILCLVGLLVLRKMIRNQDMTLFPSRIGIWFAFFFSAAMAGFWEIYEFTIDRLFGLLSQNGSLWDTMVDIICGTVGAAGTALFLVFKAKRHPLSILAAEQSHS